MISVVDNFKFEDCTDTEDGQRTLYFFECRNIDIARKFIEEHKNYFGHYIEHEDFTEDQFFGAEICLEIYKNGDPTVVQLGVMYGDDSGAYTTDIADVDEYCVSDADVQTLLEQAYAALGIKGE